MEYEREIDENFSIRDLQTEEGLKSSTKATVEELAVVEDQAIVLAKIFKRRRYLTISALVSELKKVKIGPVDLSKVLAFLCGYYAAESYNSRFDRAIFGDMASISDDKKNTILASLRALLILSNELEQKSLPDRRQSGTIEFEDFIGVIKKRRRRKKLEDK